MANEKLGRLYSALVNSGTIKEVPESKKQEIRERFISLYSRFDARLRKIDREKISVQYNKDGNIRVVCTYYGKAYGQVYDN